jgi:hypothetical protein
MLPPVGSMAWGKVKTFCGQREDKRRCTLCLPPTIHSRVLQTSSVSADLVIQGRVAIGTVEKAAPGVEFSDRVCVPQHFLGNSFMCPLHPQKSHRKPERTLARIEPPPVYQRT